MNKLTSLLSTAILTSVLIASPMLSQTVQAKEVGSQATQQNKHMGKQGKVMKQRFKKMAKFLQLSKEQRQQVKALFKSNKVKKQANRATMQAFRAQAKSLVMAPTFDDSTFLELHNQHKDQFAQHALDKAIMKHAMVQLLTEEQKEKLQQFKGHERGLF
jgi:Spy/CpxP family protein refolding chaperone